jgi:hypothetical protein
MTTTGYGTFQQTGLGFPYARLRFPITGTGRVTFAALMHPYNP